MNPRCAWRHCRSRDTALTYLGKPLCAKHWYQLCRMQERGRDAEARAQIGLRPRRDPNTKGRNDRPRGASMRPSKTRNRGDSDAGGILVFGIMAALLILLFMWLGIDCDDLACCCAAPFLF